MDYFRWDWICRRTKSFGLSGSRSITGESELILSLDAEWIKEPTGTDSNTGTYSYYSQSELRDHSDFAKRGIRGLRLKASEYSPKSNGPGDPLNCFGYHTGTPQSSD